MDRPMRWIALLALASCGGAAAVVSEGASAPTQPSLTAEQIVERNVAARGGLEAWRKVQTMAWTGHMESADGPVSNMPFMLEQKRPNKTRFEMMAMSQKTLRVFDGAHGWKMRPARDGRPQVQPFSPQEIRFARDEYVIDGPLIDHVGKGNEVTLQGIEEVEGQRAYRLGVRLASGERQEVWIDARSFLDLKFVRTTYSSSGKSGTVTVFYRNYKAIEGLQIPTLLEIGVGSARVPDRMVIERVALNPPLEERAFSRPGGPRRDKMITIEAEPDPAGRRGPVAPPAP
jgi:outer membrane lipoprotein-sorting protein